LPEFSPALGQAAGRNLRQAGSELMPDPSHHPTRKPSLDKAQFGGGPLRAKLECSAVGVRLTATHPGMGAVGVAKIVRLCRFFRLILVVAHALM
jgi:hypothetical protein